MPYKDPLKQKEAQAKLYVARREKILARRKERRSALRKAVNEYKLMRGCEDCGYDRFAECLEAHHTGDDKEAMISRMARDLRPFEDILQELTKCAIVCNRCHRERHLTDANLGHVAIV